MTHEYPICIVCRDECGPDHDPQACLDLLKQAEAHYDEMRRKYAIKAETE